MYKTSRQGRVTEQLALCDKDGNPAEILDIDIDVNELGDKFNKAYNEVLRANRDIKAIEKISKKVIDGVALTPEDMEKCEAAQTQYGIAVISMFNILFGEENTKKILEFYENQYTEMSNQIFPFIYDVIMPAVEKSSAERRKQLADNYKSYKPQRGHKPSRKR